MQDHQQDRRPITSVESMASSSRRVPGPDAFCWGATVRSEDVGERIEHSPGRARLKGIKDRLGSPSRLHETLFSKNGQMLGRRRLA